MLRNIVESVINYIIVKFMLDYLLQMHLMLGILIVINVEDIYMTNYCIYCYKVFKWEGYERTNWWKWKLVGSCHLGCYYKK